MFLNDFTQLLMNNNAYYVNIHMQIERIRETSAPATLQSELGIIALFIKLKSFVSLIGSATANASESALPFPEFRWVCLLSVAYSSYLKL